MTPEKIEQERKAFEEWYASTYLPTPMHGRTFNKYPTGVYCLQHVQDAWQAWQARAAQSEWISVEDRMPEIDEFVLVLRAWDGKLSQCVDKLELHHDCEEPEGKQDWYDFLYSYICEVTHWQPLPEPPETRGK